MQCAVCSVQCAVCGVRCAVCGVRCAVCGVRCTVCGVRCAVCGVRCAVCGVRYAVCGMRYAVCGVRCAVYGVRCTVCGVRCTVCGVRCAVGSVLLPVKYGTPSSKLNTLAVVVEDMGIDHGGADILMAEQLLYVRFSLEDTTLQTINFDINQLLKKIKSGDFLIPQFQRDFTWKEGQTKLLIDSIARNYPVGSLLILGKNDEVPLKSRRLDAEYPPKLEQSGRDTEFDDPAQDSFYVLDGQQRLTSIARVFLDAHPSRNYYFDLKRMHEFFSNENPGWIVSRARGKKNPERKDNTRLIRSDVALNQAKCDVYISEYIEDSGDFPEFKKNRQAGREAAAKIKGVFETIRKFSIPFIVLDNDAPLESVCRVFETINSTGTRLTTFDLAVARYYPEPDIKELMDDSINRYPLLLAYEVDGERILQVLSLYHLRHIGKFPEATRSVLLSLDPKFIRDEWSKATDHINEVCEWANKLGATPSTQPPQGTIVSIAAALMCFPGRLRDFQFSNVIRKWYFCTTLAADPSPANNYKTGADFRKFCEFLDENKIIPYPRVHFTTDDLISIRHATDSRYKAIQALMRTTAREDLITGNNLDKELEDHHIFPYSLTKSGLDKNKINSVVNKIIVSRETNRRLANNTPDKYISDVVNLHKRQGNHADLDRRLEDCLMPYFSTDPELTLKLSIAGFDQFLQDRAQLIIERIRDIVGDAWQYQDASEDENIEDAEMIIE